MIRKTLAIPLADHPWSGTSRIVRWLTPEHGKIATLLRGAMRPKSPFIGEYETFGTSELLFFEKPGRTVPIAKECALLRPRPAFRHDWRAMLSARRLVRLFDRAVPDDAPHPEYFDALETLLDLAAEYGASPAFAFWAELHLCDRFGYAPVLGRCVRCGATEPLAFFAPAEGGTICRTCAGSMPSPPLPLPPDVLAMLRAWQPPSHPRAIALVRLSDAQARRLDELLSLFLSHRFRDADPTETHLPRPPQNKH